MLEKGYNIQQIPVQIGQICEEYFSQMDLKLEQ